MLTVLEQQSKQQMNQGTKLIFITCAYGVNEEIYSQTYRR
jgi:hypothetical protein